MAARLEALAQYYQQHGRIKEAEELREKARQYKEEGMPNEFPIITSPIEHTNLRFSSASNPLKFTKKNKTDFYTASQRIPHIGDVRLSGNRPPNDPLKAIVGITLQGEQLVNRRYRQFIRDNLYLLEMEVIEGHATVELPPNHELFCRMDIEGTNLSLKAKLESFDDGNELASLSHFDWKNIHPEGTTTYAFFASPKDHALFSRLVFSFYSEEII